MTTSQPPYHHGDLRRALIAEGERLVAEVGPAAISLREVARRLGVSHNAPYRHFATREALLAEIAAAGYADLSARTAAAGASSAPEDMTGRGLAYVAFALERPALFRLMFSGLIDKAAFPDLARTAADSLARIRRAIAGAYGNDEHLGEAVLAAWSFVHGLAQLLLDDQVSPDLRRGRDDMALAEATLAAMAHALGAGGA